MTAAWDSEEECLLKVLTAAAACVVEEEQRNKRKKRDVWCKPLLQTTERFSYNTISNKLSCKVEHFFRNNLCLTPELFTHLLRLISPFIEKENTLMRDSISPGERLQATLFFLAKGGSYSSLRTFTGISQPSLSSIIPETCQAIYEALKAEYVKIPRTANEWRNIATDFRQKWNFPNALGAIAAKHIEVRPPSGIGYKSKSSHSFVVIAVVDASSKFIYVDVLANEKFPDTRVYHAGSLKSAIESRSIDIPPKENIPDTDIPVPYVFLGDCAFLLKPYLMTPYRFNNQTQEMRIFSNRVSHARRSVENAFEILATRFRVLSAPINLHPTKVEKIVFASVALHNFLLTENSAEYSDTSGTESHQLMVLESIARGASSNEAKTVRKIFTRYFNYPGQADRIH